MRTLSTSAIAILAASGFVFGASAQQADQQQQEQQAAANGQCELEFAEVDDRIAQDDELRAQMTSDVVRDLRRMRNAAITLEQYGRSQACQEVVVAIHEILENPEQFGIAEAPEEDPDVAEARDEDVEDPAMAEAPEEDAEVAETPEEDSEVAEAPDEPVEDAEVAEAPEEDAQDPEVTAAVPQEDEEVAAQEEPAQEEELTWQQRVETDHEAAVGLAEMDAQIRLNELIGTDVRDSRGEHVGDVDDVVIGQQGEPDYIVVSHGGFLGIGDDLIPVPFDQVRISPDMDGVYLPITEAELEQAPTIARGDDRWFQDRGQQDQTAQFYQRD